MTKLIGILLLSLQVAGAALREENFDREPPNWEGVNYRSRAFEPRTVKQDFGYNASRGQIGGLMQPAGEPAYYGFRLPQPLSFETPITVEGRLHAAEGGGHCLIGFFNTNTLNEWRTPNTLVARINQRGPTFHCHLEYCTRRWRAGAGVIGHIVPGQRIDAKSVPSGQWYPWTLKYDPASATVTMTLGNDTATCEITPEHRQEGVTFTHFGLLALTKTWDSGGEVWVDDLVVNGQRFDFAADPQWEAFNNRRTYVSPDTRPRFDFGWSPTHFAGGRKPGELGGLIFRGDCREPARMACYGDKLETLNLEKPLIARGKLAMLRGVTDSTASIGFYHATHSMQSNPSQKHSIPMDYIGINIEGPSSEGFFFYPVYRVHGDEAGALGSNGNKSPRIFPDRKVHDWFLRYDPEGNGRITVGLDDQTCELELAPGAKQTGATFNRFGIATPWIDGNSVTVYFDDLTYTAAP